MFVLADSKGFMYDFIPYTGKIHPLDDENVPNLNPRANSVLHLAQAILSDKNYLLFFDNWFTSLSLMQYLTSRRIWYCGTICPNRVKDFKLSK